MFLRSNIELICDDDDETMLVIGQQVMNAQKGRSDLTALDGQGNIVLIEIKRDIEDIEQRREAFEFQAIRYAASYASIKSREELVQKVYEPYVKKHRDEFGGPDDLTPFEVAQRKLDEFVDGNDIHNLNERQRIFLVASDFDAQTLSAVAWLDANGVDITCYRLIPYRFGKQVLIQSSKILPLDSYDSLYVEISEGSKGNGVAGDGRGKRQYKPRIKDLIENGIISAGAILSARKRDGEEAELLESGKVKLSTGDVLSLNRWLQDVYGWSAVDVYEWAVDKETGKTLDDLRNAWMASQAAAESE